MINSLPRGYSIGAMTRAEASLLDEWAAGESWNPGLNDIDVAWGFDPEAFIALRRGDEFIGGGSIISYHGAAGFMGLFILRADHRGKGLGTLLWHERLRRLRMRLEPKAPIGMDGVLEMAPFYQRGGFEILYRDLRYQGVAAGGLDGAAVPLGDVDFALIDAYDRLHVEAPRTDFLRAWLGQKGGLGVALIDAGELSGYGFLRPCRQGYKAGPVFAGDAASGERLIHSLLSLVPGEQVQLDVPELNPDAVRIAESMGWTRSFACARMVNGQEPGLPVNRIFGVTSFEFG
jgi:hypothetical protein